MRTIEDLIKEFGEIPFCKCGCGNKVNIFLNNYSNYKRRGGFPKFLPSHNTKGINHPLYGKHPSKESIKNMSNSHIGLQCGKNNSKYNPNIHKSIEQIEKELGIIPFCGCSCGNKVNINPKRYEYYKENGYPQYISGHARLGKGKTINQIIQELGKIPLCQCGCGHEVNVNLNRRYAEYKKNGYPKFITGHNTGKGENNLNYTIPKTLEDCVKDIGEIPFCECNCGNKINVNPRYYLKYKKEGYPKIIVGHLKGENAPWFGIPKEKHPQYNPEIPHTVEELIFKLGEPPLCACGCGQKVNINPERYQEYKKYGYPKYLSGDNTNHTEQWKKYLSEKMSGENHPLFGKTGKLSLNYGKKRTEEQKIKMSGKNHPNFGKPAPKGSGHGIGDYHQTPNQGIVWMKSQWELKYADYLEKNNIDYYYELYGFEMNIGFDTTYYPDFFLLTENKFIEIKGRNNYNKWEDTDISKQKSNKFKFEFCQNWSYEVLFKEDLKKLNII